MNTATTFVNLFFILLPSFFTLVHRHFLFLVVHILHLLFLRVEKSSTTVMFLLKVISTNLAFDAIVSVSVDLLL